MLALNLPLDMLLTCCYALHLHAHGCRPLSKFLQPRRSHSLAAGGGAHAARGGTLSGVTLPPLPADDEGGDASDLDWDALE